MFISEECHPQSIEEGQINLGLEATTIDHTTCVAQPRNDRTVNLNVNLPRMSREMPNSKTCNEKLLVQIALSIWLLRSKLHRKEFRRKARWNI